MLLHRGSHVRVRYKLSHPQAFEEEATGGKPGNIKVPALDCWGKVKLQVALLIVFCVRRPQPVDWLQHKGLFSLTSASPFETSQWMAEFCQ